MKFIKVLSALSIVIVAQLTSAAEPTKTATFISIADIHFDPFSSCSILRKPCQSLTKLRETPYPEWPRVFEQYESKSVIRPYHDTNYYLFKKTLVELKNVSQKENPAFVLILGDFLSHDFRKKYKRYSNDMTLEGYQAFVKKTFQYMTYELAKTFPTTDVYPVVGNNDTYSGDYQLVPNGKFFEETKETWSVLIKNKSNKESFKQQFPHAGYYKVSLPTDSKHQILVINSVLFSIRNRNDAVKIAALDELKWVQMQLQNADKNHDKLLLAYHIPVGVDVFATFKARFSEIKEFWKSSYSEKFKNELMQYSNVVTAMFAGHIHMETYQTITLKKFATIPVIITPSVSPIFGNSPAFKVITFDTQTFQLKNIDTYNYSLDISGSNWRKETALLQNRTLQLQLKEVESL